jgi:hypothetical protein
MADRRRCSSKLIPQDASKFSAITTSFLLILDTRKHRRELQLPR